MYIADGDGIGVFVIICRSFGVFLGPFGSIGVTSVTSQLLFILSLSPPRHFSLVTDDDGKEMPLLLLGFPRGKNQSQEESEQLRSVGWA